MTAEPRPLVLVALQDFELDVGVADIVVELAERLRDRTRRSPRKQRQEFAGMVDMQTGEQVGLICSGEPDKVDITPQLQAAQGRAVVSIHTHPGNSSFSPRDVQVFLSEPAMRLLVVVGADGTWYLLSAQPDRGKNQKLIYVIQEQYERAALDLAGVYRALRQRGLLSRAQAWQEQSHEVWVKVAPPLGLRYDRVKAAPAAPPVLPPRTTEP